jgi:glycine/D-amino acid oxidase-like deaminating enzyme
MKRAETPRKPTSSGSSGVLPVSDAPWRSTVSPDIEKWLSIPQMTSAQVADWVWDVAIIGGGIAGLSAAVSASQSGANVLLLERAPGLGYGATGRNAGILGAGVNMPLVNMPKDDPAMELWHSTSELVLKLYQIADSPHSLLEAKNVGALSLSTTDAATVRLHKEVAARNKAGLKAEIIAPKVVKEITSGQLNLRGVKCSLWLPDEGRINPLTLLAHQSKAAQQAGTTIYGKAEVIRWKEAATTVDGLSKQQWILDLAGGTQVRSRALIVATGPIEKANHRIYALSFKYCFPDDFPLFWDAAPFTYYDYRSGDGYLIVSGGRYGKAGSATNDLRYHKAMAAAARAWLPDLKSQDPTNQWAVDLSVSHDMIPAIRKFSKKAPGFAIEGLGALGVLPGMVLGAQAGKLACRQ